ncbi:MAG: chorismate synthase [Deltaproteobacteria bacterium]|nr:chorismate synthase [Deltaproteobacteria bacterium]
MSSSFGQILKVTTFGESHGKGIGVVVDGYPAGISLKADDIQAQLDRRRPGQSSLTTDRGEADRVTILSGVEHGRTLGIPIALFVANKDQRPGDYQSLREVPRPSHADYTYQVKYGTRSSSGGGRASARETIARVAAGAVAEKMIRHIAGMDIVAWVSSVGPLDVPAFDWTQVSRADVDRHPVRCPHAETADAMAGMILEAKDQGNSLGGIITCVCRNIPAGLGEPVFDKMEALLAHAMLSIPATKGFEIGSGFGGTRMRGSEHNDPFIRKGDRLGTETNNSGGVQGGITNGEPVVFRVAFKPVATIGLEQHTVGFDGKTTVLKAKGRHDPCVLPRAVPIVEGMTALVLGDMLLLQKMRETAQDAIR